MVGLSGREEHRPQRLSAGEQQRVAIARALANNPAIILADEPTGNLDSQNKQGIIKLLANLNLTQGTTIIMVTHDSQAARNTERMLLLKDGKIVKEMQGLMQIKRTRHAHTAEAAFKPLTINVQHAKNRYMQAMNSSDLKCKDNNFQKLFLIFEDLLMETPSPPKPNCSFIPAASKNPKNKAFFSFYYRVSSDCRFGCRRFNRVRSDLFRFQRETQ